jgi:hypothetical protein
MTQNPPVVSYTCITPTKEEVLLRVDIYQYVPAPPFNQLPNHLQVSLLMLLRFVPIM